jgi:uncharacterized protein (DUF302 family)
MPPAILLTLALLFASPARAAALPGTETLPSRHDFATLLARTEAAIPANGMLHLSTASASAGARARGISIPGNAVVMVFRSDFAVRLLAASIDAGIEAPLRLYVTEAPGGTARITWRRPTAVFAPYATPALDALAAELDPIIARIATQAASEN